MVRHDIDRAADECKFQVRKTRQSHCSRLRSVYRPRLFFRRRKTDQFGQARSLFDQRRCMIWMDYNNNNNIKQSMICMLFVRLRPPKCAHAMLSSESAPRLPPPDHRTSRSFVQSGTTCDRVRSIFIRRGSFVRQSYTHTHTRTVCSR